jgi:signal transduction histidine kinase
VKLWSADGRIVYSDERRLIGERYPLGADELRVLRDGGVEAEISDLTRPENRFERPLHRLREVYLPLRGPGGRRLLFEEYLRDSSIVADGQRLFGSLAPVLIGALLVLALVQIPLAASLARRLQRGRRERELLLEQAVAASALERERIARDLHDGVVQQLAGVSYELSAASAEALGGGAPAGATLRRAGDQIRRVMRQLRTLLVELYPETLQRQGLEAALTDLLARVHAHAIATELEIEPAVRLDPAGEALVFRTAQEALRNVTAHADARSVAVRLTSHGDRCALHVIDDGVGMQPPGDDRPRLGLRMLGDLARQAGGELSVRDAPQGGTALELRLPARR